MADAILMHCDLTMTLPASNIVNKNMIAPLKVELKNAEDKDKIPTDLQDPYLPGLFVYQGIRGLGKTYAYVQICRHLKQKGTVNTHSCYVFLLVITTRIRKKPFIQI